LSKPSEARSRGWLIVEDLAMVVVLVVLPAVRGLFGGERRGRTAVGGSRVAGADFGMARSVDLVKVNGLVAVSSSSDGGSSRGFFTTSAYGSRELFRLAVLAIALGVTFGSAELFDVSFALVLSSPA